MRKIFLTAASTKYSCGRCLGLSMLLVLLSFRTAEGAVSLAWDPNPESDIAGYVISYGTSSRQYTTSVDVGDTTTFVFAQPDPTKVYYLAVQAYNTAGLRSAFSNEVSTSATRPLTATGLTSNAPSQTRVGSTITFTATATGGIGPYQYKWWVFDGTRSTIGKNWSTQNTFVWTPTQPKPAYRITVWLRSASNTADNFENPGATLSMTVAVVASLTLTVNGVSPSAGASSGGTAVTITGSNFSTGSTVSFGGVPATSVTVVNGTTITARTPAHAAGPVAVAVTNASRQSGTRANAFTYTAPVQAVAPPPSAPTSSLAPTVTSIVPNSGSSKGGTTVTITGTNFVPGATVTFGGVPSATTVLVATRTSIVATTPSHADGIVNVVVTNPDRKSGAQASGFKYIAPIPPPGSPVSTPPPLAPPPRPAD